MPMNQIEETNDVATTVAVKRKDKKTKSKMPMKRRERTKDVAIPVAVIQRQKDKNSKKQVWANKKRKRTVGRNQDRFSKTRDRHSSDEDIDTMVHELKTRASESVDPYSSFLGQEIQPSAYEC